MIQTANGWNKRLEEIYPNKGVMPDTMMVHIFTWCSEVDRLLIRTPKPTKGSAEADRINRSIVKAIAWIIALCNNYNLDFVQVMIGRFPKCCPYCQLSPCRCEEQERMAFIPGTSVPMAPAAARIEFSYKIGAHSRRDYSFDKIIAILRDIYPANRVLLSKGHTSDIVDKLLEEGGELKVAYAQYELANVLNYARFADFILGIAEEVADLSAWHFSCWDISRQNISFDDRINEIFRLGCNTCKSTPCKCVKYHASFNLEKTIEKFYDDLSRAARTSAADSGVIEAAEELIKEAISARSSAETIHLLERADKLNEDEVRRFTKAAIDRLVLTKPAK